MDQEKSEWEDYDSWPITENSFADKFFYKLNRNTFDKVSAQTLFESHFAEKLFKEDTLNIIVGSDSGLLIEYILSKPFTKGTRYIFIEPDMVLSILINNGLLESLDEQYVQCISLENWNEAIQKFKIKDYFYINAVQSINSFCAQDDFIQEYAEISWHITERLSQLHWSNSMELGSEAFISRQITNFADNLRPAKLLQNCFLNKTVILLAGGPSLDLALPWVIENRDKLVVFAVSRISRQLQLANLEPDFIFSVDPTELSFDVSKEMLDFGRKTIFVCSNHTVPSLLNQWTGLSLFLGSRLPWKSSLNVANLSSAGPTVTNTALNVAYEFGFKRIILAGVDLCFTRDGYTHAKGSNEYIAGPRFNLTSLQIETNNGLKAPSSCDFAQAILSLGLQASLLTGKGCEILNISADAAKVENIAFISLAEIELNSLDLDVFNFVKSKILDWDSENEFYKQALVELNRAVFQIKAIAKLAEQARNINDAMYNDAGRIENYKDKRRLDQIEKKFKRDHRQFSILVKKYGIRSFIKLNKPFTDEEWTASEAKELGNVFYDAYQEGTLNLLKLLEQSRLRVISRQEELKDAPDFMKIIQQAEKDRSFGRVRLWRKKFSLDGISEQTLMKWNEFEAQFQTLINDKNTRHLSQAKQHSSLDKLKQRANLLFKHKKVEELKDLLSGLDKYDQQTDTLAYRLLINGYLAELQNQIPAALSAYQNMVDAGDLLLEEALIGISRLSLLQEDIVSANLSLQCLSQINPQYLPLYADMLGLQGKVLQAIDIYNQYIAEFKNDTLAQIKLAMLYAENNVFEAADLMLDFILEKQPDLLSALRIKHKVDVMKNNHSLMYAK